MRKFRPIINFVTFQRFNILMFRFCWILDKVQFRLLKHTSNWYKKSINYSALIRFQVNLPFCIHLWIVFVLGEWHALVADSLLSQPNISRATPNYFHNHVTPFWTGDRSGSTISCALTGVYSMSCHIKFRLSTVWMAFFTCMQIL